MTPEQLEPRLGKATSSNFSSILAKGRNGQPSASRKNYRSQLAIERLTGQSADRFDGNKYTDWGIETEALAKTAFTLRTGLTIIDPEFTTHDWLEAGATTDGNIGDNAIAEVKNLTIANHVAVLKAGRMPPKHKPQVQGGLWIKKRQFCYFISYIPELPEESQLFIEKVERDEDYIKDLSVSIAVFLDEVEAEVKFLKDYKGDHYGNK